MYKSYFAEYCVRRTSINTCEDKFLAVLQLNGSVYKLQTGDMGVVAGTYVLLEFVPVHFSTCTSTGGNMADQGATGGAAATAIAANDCLLTLPFPPSDIGNFNLHFDLDDNEIASIAIYIGLITLLICLTKTHKYLLIIMCY